VGAAGEAQERVAVFQLFLEAREPSAGGEAASGRGERGRVLVFDMNEVARAAALGTAGSAEEQEMVGLFEGRVGRVLRADGRGGGPRVLKLGFQVRDDLGKMARRHPRLAPVFADVRGLLDLATVNDRLRRAASAAAAKQRGAPDLSPGGADMASLTRVVSAFLGDARGALSKDQTLSDWDRRPLSPQQMRYAGVDAWVLAPLYHAMAARAHAAGLGAVCEPGEYMYRGELGDSQGGAGRGGRSEE